jgi:hypothetical protein
LRGKSPGASAIQDAVAANVDSGILPGGHGMIQRSDIIWLGVASGVIGSLVGGMMLGIGLDLLVSGEPHGWLLLLPGAPVSAIPGWLLARRLARQL